MALATHIETNEVSIKDILGPSDNASAFGPEQNCRLFLCSGLSIAFFGSNKKCTNVS